jgi:hypothetical protein
VVNPKWSENAKQAKAAALSAELDTHRADSIPADGSRFFNRLRDNLVN